MVLPRNNSSYQLLRPLVQQRKLPTNNNQQVNGQTAQQNFAQQAADDADNRDRFAYFNEEQDRFIFACTTLFPFVLFPNTIEIREKSIILIYRHFFGSKHILPILVQDLVNVNVTTDILFGSLSFELMSYQNNPEPIAYLNRNDAYTARKIITGLVMCFREAIDTSQFSPLDLRLKLEEMGDSILA